MLFRSLHCCLSVIRLRATIDKINCSALQYCRAQITPPVGFNLYVLQSLAKKSMGYVALAALPFFVGMLIMVGIVYVVPDLVTWLPNQMLGKK